MDLQIDSFELTFVRDPARSNPMSMLKNRMTEVRNTDIYHPLTLRPQLSASEEKRNCMLHTPIGRPTRRHAWSK
jgi:hypothetical protein